MQQKLYNFIVKVKKLEGWYDKGIGVQYYIYKKPNNKSMHNKGEGIIILLTWIISKFIVDEYNLCRTDNEDFGTKSSLNGIADNDNNIDFLYVQETKNKISIVDKKITENQFII